MANVLWTVRSLLRRSRWNEYRDIVRAAVERGYRVLTVCQWLDLGDERRRTKALVLRHDVDTFGRLSLEFHRIERQFGVGGTYYFRWSTAEAGLIRTLRREGAEVGLHHESLRFLAIARGLGKPEDVTDAVLDDAAKILAAEIEIFERLHGPIRTVAAHGSPEHRRLNVRDVEVYERLPASVRERVHSAYRQDLVDAFDEYVSDTNPPLSWKYGRSAIRAMDEGRERICFLSHPAHWGFSLRTNAQRVFRRMCRRQDGFALACDPEHVD